MQGVLVTGGAGFVGSHVAEYYAEQETEVTALDNLSRIETLEDADESRDTGAYNWRYLQENYPDVVLVANVTLDEVDTGIVLLKVPPVVRSRVPALVRVF